MPTSFRLFLTAATAVALAACGGGADDAPASPAGEAATGSETPAANSGTIALPRSPSPEGARVFFITPADGDVVVSPVRIEFGIEGMSIAPAGDATKHSGHHHLIVNAGLPATDMPIPASENYIHFGDGSTSTSLDLEPGEHTLQLLLGDHLHIPHDPPVSSEVITITVPGITD